MDNHSSATLMTSGPIWKRIIAFAIPLFFGNLFQQLYNTADSLIVGNFLGSSALAAVSSSGNLIFLLVGFFNGIAVGSGVVVAKYFGAGKFAMVRQVSIPLRLSVFYQALYLLLWGFLPHLRF